MKKMYAFCAVFWISLLLTGISAWAQPTLQYYTPAFNTGSNALAVVPLTSTPNIGGIPLQAGDEIAVFTPGGICAGAVAWTDTGNVAVVVWGDNVMTPATDGMLTGEQLRWRVWRQSNNTEYTNVTVVYTAGGFFNSSGNYSPNAIYFLSSLVATPTGLEVGLRALPDTVCQGGSTNLSALVVGGTPPFSYSWQSRPLGGTFAPMTGVQTSSHTVNNISNATEFRVIVTDSQQRSRTTSTIVHVVQPPVLVVTGNSTVCRAFQQQYSTSLTRGDSLRWSVSGGVIVEGATSANVTVVWQTSPATLSLTYYSSLCGVRSTSLVVQSFTEPTPRITGEQQTCRLSTYRYSTASPTTNTFSWSVVGGTITEGLGTTSITVQWITSVTLGTVTLLEGNSVCPSVSTSLSVVIAEPPRAAISGTTAVCLGDTAVYRAPRREGDSYQWTVSGGRLLSAATADSVRIIWETTTTASAINLVQTSPWCGTSSANVVIDVAPLPQATIISTTDFCAQSNYTFQARGNGGNFQWNVTGAEILAATGATLQIRTGTSSTFSIELREISPRCGISITTAVFSIQPLPRPQITGETIVCAFSTGAVYSVNPTSTHTYQWSVSGGRIIGGQSTATITVEWFGSSSGTVQVLQSSPFCGNSTASLLVNIIPLPTPAIGGNTIVCANSQGNIYSVESIAGTTYLWEVEGGTINGSSTSSTISVAWGSSGIGQVKVYQTSALCGTFADTLNIVKSAQIQPRISGRETVCPQTITAYSVGFTTGDSYNWSVQGGTILGRNDSSTVVISWGATAPFRLTIEQTSPICGSGTTTLTLKAASAELPVISGKNQVCKQSIEKYVVENSSRWQQTQWQASGATILAFSENEVTVRWSESGKITLVAQSTEGCISVSEISVAVEKVPSPVFATLPIACGNQPVRYILTEREVNLQSQWQIIGGTIIEQSEESILVQWQNPNGELRCWFTSLSGCDGDTISQPISVTPMLQAEILQGDTIFTEQGKTLQLDLRISGGSSAERRITWESQTEIEEISPVLVQLTPTTTTNVSAIISDGDYCADTVSAVIIVTPPVTVTDIHNNTMLQLAVFPAPASSIVYVRATLPRTGLFVRIVMYDNIGTEILELHKGITEKESLELLIPVDMFANGIYTIGVLSSEGNIYKQIPIVK